MGGCNVGEPGLLNFFAVDGILDVVDVMDVPCTVELGHEEGIAVPELVLNKRSVKLLKAQGCELVLDPADVISVRVVPAGDEAGDGGIEAVRPELRILPCAGCKHGRGQDPDFLTCDVGLQELFLGLLSLLREGVDHVFPFSDFVG